MNNLRILKKRWSFFCCSFLGIPMFGVLFSGCVVVPQIDRDLLAKRYLQFDPSPQLKAFSTEAKSIREGAAGGSDQSAGGGCGCN